MYGTSDGWSQPTQADSPLTTAAYMGYPLTSTRTSDGQFTLGSNFEPSCPPIYNKTTSKHSFTDFGTRSGTNATIAPFGVSTTLVYPSSAIFAASNAHLNLHNAATISPLETGFDVDHASPSSDSKLSFDSHMQNSVPLSFTPLPNEADPSSSKRRCDSLQSTFEAQSPNMGPFQVGRRRGSEYAEPGSARAVYLEKNRKAASKCRSKQKRQQEELVQTARDVERRNKILKAEVELLRGGMRDLMELVGQHSECPDTRLKLYVQREADRLAIGGQRNAHSSRMSRSIRYCTGSADGISPPEE
jgi:cyclic AMP-dependent transcription factor ATF-2